MARVDIYDSNVQSSLKLEGYDGYAGTLGRKGGIGYFLLLHASLFDLVLQQGQTCNFRR